MPWQTLCAEIDIHEAHKDAICKRGQELVESEHPEAEQVADKTQDLQGKYDNLKKLSDDYKAQLDLSLQAKQVRLVFEYACWETSWEFVRKFVYETRGYCLDQERMI